MRSKGIDLVTGATLMGHESLDTVAIYTCPSWGGIIPGGGMTSKAVVLHSGGLDSTVCLLLALERVFELLLLSIVLFYELPAGHELLFQ